MNSINLLIKMLCKNRGILLKYVIILAWSMFYLIKGTLTEVLYWNNSVIFSEKEFFFLFKHISSCNYKNIKNNNLKKVFLCVCWNNLLYFRLKYKFHKFNKLNLEKVPWKFLQLFYNLCVKHIYFLLLRDI